MKHSQYLKTALMPTIVLSMFLIGSTSVANAQDGHGYKHGHGHVRHVQVHGHGHVYGHAGHGRHGLGHGCGLFRSGCGHHYVINRWNVKPCPCKVNRCCGFNFCRSCL